MFKKIVSVMFSLLMCSAVVNAQDTNDVLLKRIDMLEKKGICTKDELRASVETFINHDAKQPE